MPRATFVLALCSLALFATAGSAQPEVSVEAPVEIPECSGSIDVTCYHTHYRTGGWTKRPCPVFVDIGPQHLEVKREDILEPSYCYHVPIGP